MKKFTHYLKNEAATQEVARCIAAHCQPPLQITLSGDLGAGKTTLIRALLRALGVAGAIKSPTYSLVEPYHMAGMDIFHVDLYRLGDPEELELIGWRDYHTDQALTLIEWPEKAHGALPKGDIDGQLTVSGEGRVLILEAKSEKGVKIVTDIREQLAISD